MRRTLCLWVLFGLVMLLPRAVLAQADGDVRGWVTDESGGALPGVTVVLRAASGSPQETVTDGSGEYRFAGVAPGKYQVAFTLINFAPFTRRDVTVGKGVSRIDAVLYIALSSEVSVVGKRTFANIADMENPAESLLGVAQAASQGAITAKELEVRPLLRVGEVLETVPGMIASAHAGGGKANQYYMRGFNLDHGTDFAQTIAGTPVNLPSHAHGQGYSDINFMIPELVVGVQYSKGPYYADQGDFTTAGSANTNYATSLDRPILHVELGGQGYQRGLFAGSRAFHGGTLLGAFEVSHADGPWVQPDDFQRFNGVLRYTRGDAVNGFSITGMGYHGTWTSTDTVPQRALASGLISRFDTLDATDGGSTYRYSLSGDWQRGSGSTVTKLSAYGFAYDLGLFSNFTFFLDDPVHGDQHEQADHRYVTGAKLTHKRQGHWRDRAVQNTFGVQVRNDDIAELALYRTDARARLSTASQAAVLETTAGAYVQTEVEWSPWLRTMVGFRADATRFSVDDRLNPVNSGTTSSGVLSPKGGVTLGPWAQTEFYANAGQGFHSNDARGVVAVRDTSGHRITPVTPLVKATGAEVGIRTVLVPHLQSTVSLWMLRLDSELTWDGDTFGSIPSPASRRSGLEIANYYSPQPWLTFDADFSWSQARYRDVNPAGQYVPEAVGSVASAGVSVNNWRYTFGSLRWRYFGPRALIEDNSQRSKATGLFECSAGYQIRKIRVTGEVFNLLNSHVSDVDYYFATRLRGEPADGVLDIMTHPSMSRAARVTMAFGF